MTVQIIGEEMRTPFLCPLQTKRNSSPSTSPQDRRGIEHPRSLDIAAGNPVNHLDQIVEVVWKPESPGRHRKLAKSDAIRAPYWSAPRHCPHASWAGSACSGRRDEHASAIWMSTRDKVAVKNSRCRPRVRCLWRLPGSAAPRRSNLAGRRILSRGSIVSPMAVSVMTADRPVLLSRCQRQNWDRLSGPKIAACQFAPEKTRPGTVVSSAWARTPGPYQSSGLSLSAVTGMFSFRRTDPCSMWTSR
jgi:hypothetical protein